MKKSSDLKEFSLSSWAIDHSTVIYVIIALFFLLGVSSYLSMPRENYPEINTNEVFISSVFPGNTAEDMERLITDPLEEELKGVPNLVKITSTSLENFSLITVEFDENITKENAKIKVKDKIDAVTSSADWPTFNNAKVEPTAFEFSLSEEVPILNIGLSGDLPIKEMKFYGELLQDKIEQMSEIKEVALRGVQDFEVEVSLDLMKMNAATVSFDDVINAIARGNSTVSAGNIEGDVLRRNIRVLGEIESPEELENFVIKTQNGVLFLGDVATVTFKEKEKNSYARLDGKSALVLDVKKRSGKNLILSVLTVDLELQIQDMFYLSLGLLIQAFSMSTLYQKLEDSKASITKRATFWRSWIVIVMVFLGETATYHATRRKASPRGYLAPMPFEHCILLETLECALRSLQPSIR